MKPFIVALCLVFALALPSHARCGKGGGRGHRVVAVHKEKIIVREARAGWGFPLLRLHGRLWLERNSRRADKFPGW